MLHQVPAYYTNVISAAEGRAIVPTFQSGYVFNALTPSVVYEPKLARAVYPNTIPVVGVNTRANDCAPCCVQGDCKERNERDLTDAIDKKVKEQIERYNAEMERQARANCVECCAADLAKNPLPIIEPCLKKMENLSCCENMRPKSPCCENMRPKSPCCENMRPKSPCCENMRPKSPCCQGKYELSIDDKIQMIRRSLNLPDEKPQHQLLARLDAEKRKYEQHGFFTDDRSEVASSAAPTPRRSRSRSTRREEGCDRHRSRSRSFDERQAAAKEELRRLRSLSRSCSRNRDGSRPKQVWMPTGNNDFSRTVEARNKMVLQTERRKFMLDSLDTLNREKVLNKQPKHLVSAKEMNIVTTFPPPEEQNYYRPTESSVQKTNTYIRATFAPVPEPKQFPYVRFSPANVQQNPPANNVQSNNNGERLFLRATYAPIPEPQRKTVEYSRPATSMGHSAPRTNDINCYDLRPIQATKGGAIYSCSNKNELHYVSNKARNTIQICTSNNGYSRNADNRVRIINSDHTVIHD